MENDINFVKILKGRPEASAQIRGRREYPNINGTVSFYKTGAGILVAANIWGLPLSSDGCSKRVFGFHIHEGISCSGNENDPFADALGHYNPGKCFHPYHAGDMPPLFGANGRAFLIFLTDRFNISEIIGKTVIIHSAPDDFTTQPSGNSMAKIACGVIERYKLRK